MAEILIVDDDHHLRQGFQRLLDAEGYETRTAASAEEALNLMREKMPQCVVMDVRMPGMDGLEALKRMRALEGCPPVVIMTAYSTTETAIEATRLGAFDYMLKPFDIPQVLELLQRALAAGESQRRHEAQSAEESLGEEDDIRLVGHTPPMQELYKAIGRVAPTDALVLIRGESGTGKELVANAIWRYSPRSRRPFSVINCVAIPDTLLESELFGYERGAFTGAQHRRIGRIEQAAGGTIFLDEIGDMPPGIQAKLLRLLQEKQIQRLGGHDSVDVDVRIIAATNANLEQAVADGRFREDLYYRLKVVTLWTPPLRERREDIPALAAFLLHRQAAELHRPDPGLEEDALRYLAGLDWPGNVRELSNALQKALVFNSGAPVSIRDLQLVLDSPAGHPPAAGPGLNGNGDAVPAPGVRRSPVGTGNGIHEGEGPYEDASAPAPAAAPHNDEQRSLASIVTACLQSGDPSPFDTCMDIMGRAVVREALRQCRGNRSQAARLLGLSRPTLLARMEKYGLKIETRISDE
ncbi:sigma-54-dependent transcriptional regulator [Desulfovibrio piger]|uniref:sigma-54-dependent transcriptional regulator n=1 Tax=Desulfovibrio piger TaxID=901 RepID=UPI003F0564E6